MATLHTARTTCPERFILSIIEGSRRGPYNTAPCPPPKRKCVKKAPDNGAKNGRRNCKIDCHLLWHDVVAGVGCGGSRSYTLISITVEVISTARAAGCIGTCGNPIGIPIFPTAIRYLHRRSKMIHNHWGR